MEEITGLGMKNSLTLPSLGWKHFNILRDDNDDSVYTYKDKYMRCFVGESIKGGRRTALKQYFESKNLDKIFETISEELNVEKTFCELTEASVKYMMETKKQ